ncbi:MAG: MOSC domain-containing protein [Rhodospirillaceae bacterium]|jgi:uncharacterized protein|nr:MOSC domain-containing protein [Rhodospirillaceae bacterium]
MNKIESIYRYPIKGLSGESMTSVVLKAGEVIPGDREYAFARAGVQFDSDKPEYLQKTNFLALVRDEKLAEFDTRFDPESKSLSIFQDRILALEADLVDPADCLKAAEFFRDYLAILPDNCPSLVRATGGTTGHSFSDVPNKAISLINLKSVSEFGEKISAAVDPIRFRGNINFEGDEAWQEFDWLDRDLRIGEVILRAFKRTQRCAATMVNPDTAERDINVPKKLHENYAHMDMGIYTEVIAGGEIKCGDEIELI